MPKTLSVAPGSNLLYRNQVIKPLMLTYNNPELVKENSLKLLDLGFDPQEITIIENGSDIKTKQLVCAFAANQGFKLFNFPINKGWGGAINQYLEEQPPCPDEDTIILILAHDCYFEILDRDEIIDYFKDPLAIFVCPTFPEPITSHYNIFKSYYSKPGREQGLIKIGHQTGFFARASLLNSIRYDEEFWVYGGEYEIFSRANKNGLHSYQASKTIVVNPSSGFSSLYSYLAYKLNSLYYARKRHGTIGYAMRGAIIIFNIIILSLKGDKQKAVLLYRCLLFTLSNPGLGHRSYVHDPALQAKFKITPLAK